MNTLLIQKSCRVSGTSQQNERHDIVNAEEITEPDIVNAEDMTEPVPRAKQPNNKILRKCSSCNCDNTNLNKTLHTFPNIWKQKFMLNLDNVNRYCF
ncbi:Mannose-1-phosphate guanylyltransferase RfbM [Frankliniella fusca]|uniref:Mannose-1-phosphate guanylyltransferase RfbM n=1 Tax=Frankliniella fusca TaxID=407009 RepID=A0AAE1H2F1_9NEOP|nr:Mannose-1-phosphate guanylyltransferase RfbM [Frankliniella fusca]KAK3913706.1 Mannose-1-phosphate guanylyltransferase RfbM [Frankliniella fusca]